MALYVVLLLIGGFVAFIHCLSRRSFKLDRSLVSAWRIPPPDFGFFVASLALAFILVQLLFAALVPAPGEDAALSPRLMLFGGALSQLTFIAVWAFFRVNSPQHFRTPLSFAPISWSASALWALYAFLAFIPVFTIVNVAWGLTLDTVAPEALRTQEMVNALMDATSIPLLAGMFVLLVVIAPIAEELIFRGCLYRYLKGIMPMVGAVAVSSVIFGAIHLHLAGLPVLIAFGALLCFVYEKTGSLRVPVLLHAVFNLNTFVLTLLQTGGD